MQLNDETILLQLECPADCPRPSGGPSAVPFYRPTRTEYLSGQLQSIRRTFRSPLAGRPQYTYANPPETTTSLEQSLISTADCPHPSGGPSAVQSCAPPPETSSLDKLQVSTADRPLPYSGLSAVNFAKPPETTSSLDKT